MPSLALYWLLCIVFLVGFFCGLVVVVCFFVSVFCLFVCFLGGGAACLFYSGWYVNNREDT